MIAAAALALLVLLPPVLQGTSQDPGPRSGQDIDRLLGQLAVLEEDVRQPAIEALAKIGARALPKLRSTLEDERLPTMLRAGVLQVLERMGPVAAPLVPQLRQLLSHRELILRGSAVAVLMHIGPAAREALPDVRKLWKDENPLVRRDAIRVAVRLAEKPGELAPALAEALNDSDMEVRMNVVVSIDAMLGADAFLLFDRLVQCFRDPSDKVRILAVRAVARLGDQALPSLVKILRADVPGADGELRAGAAHALGLVRPVRPEQIEALLAAYRQSDPGIRKAATLGLTMLAEHAVPELGKLLDDPTIDAAMQKDILGILGAIGVPAGPQWQRIVRFLAGPDESLRLAAARCLAQMGVGAVPAAEAIAQALDDPSLEVRAAAIAAIGRLQDAATPILPRLIAILQSGDPKLGQKVGDSFVRLGRHGASAVPLLLPLLALEDPVRRSRVVACLLGVGEAAVPALQELLGTSTTAREQRGALEVLRGLGPRAQSSAGAVIRLLGSPDATLRRDAALAMMRLGEASPDATAALLGLLRDDDREVRVAAVSSLGVLGGDRPEVVNRLAEASRDRDEAVSFAAIEALGSPGNSLAVPVLTALLGHDDEFVRMRAAASLGRIGAAALSVREDLMHAAAIERSPHVAEAMREALRRIGR